MDATIKHEVVPLLPTASRAAGANNGDAVTVSGYEGNLIVVLDSGAASAGDTLTLTLEERADANDTWAALPADALYDPATGANDTFDPVTSAGASFQVKALRRSRLKAQLRAVATVAGNGSEAVVSSVHLVGMNKYTNW